MEAKPWDKVPTGVHKGNWQEELILERETGVRFYPNPRDKSTSLLTTGRCITHSDRTEPKDYVSTVNNTYTVLTDHKDYVSSDGKGPRQRAMEARLKQQVVDETQAKADADYKEKFQPRYETEHSGHFERPGFKTRPLDGDVQRVPTYTANYATDTPVTFYSHAVKNTGNVNFPVTFMPSGNNIFAKNSAFSADMKQPYPKAAETHERPLPPSRTTDYRTLRDLRAKIHTAAKATVASPNPITGATTQRIISFLDGLGSRSPLVPLGIFEDGLAQTFGVTFTPAERKAVEGEFDGECSGSLSAAEFLLLMRPSLSPRRLELVDIAFGVCDPTNKGAVTKADVALCLNSVCVLGFMPTGIEAADFEAFFFSSIFGEENSEATFDDFVEFFANLSVEVERDDAYEAIIKNMFNL
jgi:hypothetical protein